MCFWEQAFQHPVLLGIVGFFFVVGMWEAVGDWAKAYGNRTVQKNVKGDAVNIRRGD